MSASSPEVQSTERYLEEILRGEAPSGAEMMLGSESTHAERLAALEELLELQSRGAYRMILSHSENGQGELATGFFDPRAPYRTQLHGERRTLSGVERQRLAAGLGGLFELSVTGIGRSGESMIETESETLSLRAFSLPSPRGGLIVIEIGEWPKREFEASLIERLRSLDGTRS